ncbi:MAG TPA: UDP-3-O-(3-hydroxymyristoyl)glucosamine N-acyltransferase [Rhodopila sp.]|uniref:UDP-3-O-(3-hydroxymyristoyl)glucosamine N-acyltransferase n=1 Tax=Rhodopila sp. TaxID=2480087 RepID=UPI002B5BDAFD|nr:UDP-3-O-(3-hydroxymyristoyl)glucosamine N-acyltransferase [Rhodopila sp.]HVY18324.1 UDP-3-O-(3-hydroxymyristoyl)glucosamine N-acyltransferase [Rhodopila sp.]
MGPENDIAPQPGDPRFFRRAGPFTLAAVVDAAGGEAPSRRLMLHGVAPLATAAASEVSFCLNNRKNLPALAETTAGAVIVHPDMADKVPAETVAIVAGDPLVAWAHVAALFHPLPPAVAGIHPSAVVDPTAEVDPSAEIGPLCVIGAKAVVGARTRIGALASVGAGVVLGRDVRIGSHASISHALVGDRVYLYPGARVGQDGFGFAMTPDGFHTVPQLGRVVIENDVEIGANSTVDRGALDDTRIGAGTRIDNLVMIGHNVRIGKACVLVAQCGVSGSTVLEDHVIIAGQAGLVGHLRIGTGSRVGAKAGVMGDVPPRTEVVGAPAQPAKAFFKELATLRRLARAEGKRSRNSGDTD